MLKADWKPKTHFSLNIFLPTSPNDPEFSEICIRQLTVGPDTYLWRPKGWQARSLEARKRCIQKDLQRQQTIQTYLLRGNLGLKFW